MNEALLTAPPIRPSPRGDRRISEYPRRRLYPGLWGPTGFYSERSAYSTSRDTAQRGESSSSTVSGNAQLAESHCVKLNDDIDRRLLGVSWRGRSHGHSTGRGPSEGCAGGRSLASPKRSRRVRRAQRKRGDDAKPL